MMKSTGIVRKTDDLGRIVIPMELRRTLGIDERDPLEIFIDQDKIILRKYEPCCVFCGEAEDVQEHKGRKVCTKCMAEMGRKVQ